MMHSTLTRGLTTGAALAASTAATMMIAANVARRSPWAGLNAMATAIDRDEEGDRPGDRFDRSVTPAGIALLAGGMLAWGLAYEGAMKLTGRRSSLLSGALSGALAYAIDRLVLPKHLVPNFRRSMGAGGTLAKYAAVGLVSAAFARMGREAGRRRSTNAERAREAARRLEVCEESEGLIAAVQRPPADS
jgi:hypothetical protein